MFGSWGRCARFCALFLTLSFGASPAMAQACNFKVDTAVMSERLRVDILRCLVNELAAVRRENDALKRRLRDIEALMTELPAAYSNEDGVVTEVPGRAIGRASFVLSARSTGGANAMPVEQRVLEEVCGRSGGCAVSIAFRQISLFDAEPKGSVLTGPCQFTYAPGSGVWRLGAGCGDTPSGGTDGDQSAGAGGDVDPVILRAAGACLLSESEPARSVGQSDGFARDHAQGLFLIAMPARQPDGIRRFQCALVLN